MVAVAVFVGIGACCVDGKVRQCDFRSDVKVLERGERRLIRMEMKTVGCMSGNSETFVRDFRRIGCA